MKQIKTILTIMGFMTFICSVLGCNAQNNSNFKSLNVEEFDKIIQDTSIVRLDVRTAEEYADGHISNTKNIDVLKSDFEVVALKTLQKDKSVALYCRSGKRSKRAASILAKNGYNVIELNSGFNGWVDARKPVTK